ncbi:MAG: MerR family DNA-binding transcriptional regulator [Ahrensia sp.]|nr:MerR family DNA-binding transcriptional regulator [Ahrensia sp.]
MTGQTRLQQTSELEETFRIGQLAGEFDITLRALRFYEDKGLISPKRVGTTRLYSRGDRARLKIILLGKRLGFSLVDIAEILALYDPSTNNLRQITVSIEKGQEQLQKLNDERKRLDQSIQELTETIADLERMVVDTKK